MRTGISVAVDRRLQNLIVAWVRRRWPVLRLVPAPWLRPAIAPSAARLRRSLSRGALVAAALSATIVMLIR